MKTAKLNIIKLNILTAILTLIFISCAPDNQINPDLNNDTNLEKIDQRFKDRSSESEDIGHSYQAYEDLKFEIEKSKGNTASQLRAIKNHLEKQKGREDAGIAKVDAEIAKLGIQSDFPKTFTTNSGYATSEEDLLAMKRMIYSSLYYNTTRIKTLNEILEKLNKNSHHKKVITELLYGIALGIQLQLDKYLLEKLPLPDQSESEKLLEFIRNELRKKDKFGRVLNKAINDYNRNFGEIKNDVDKLANYISKQFPPNHDF
ncbi:complement regulator-acquiring protein [Borreliella tanukii]|uniref:complement regulator-acquiring protein n=1 Tax=Borreliella tanukii TaxID=56146 RepID=UPI002648A79F|nr:complement regulator-acquiring protein [Borreliella tanukii]WKC82176.1 complement regulator-acquiring protein [Borreliella tanukii]